MRSLWLKASKVCSQGVAGGGRTSMLSPVALGGLGSLCLGLSGGTHLGSRGWGFCCSGQKPVIESSPHSEVGGHRGESGVGR